MEVLEYRLTKLEEMVMRLVYIQQKTEMEIQDLKKEMKDFKDEMKQFKDEMKDFKDEMKQFKDEMKDFKDEMKDFKDEMKEFKDEVKMNIRELNRKWGDISNKLGTIVEDIIFPATESVLTSYFGCYIDDLQLNRKKKRDNMKDEFDVIAVSQSCKTVFLIEVKATPKIEYINEFKDKKVGRFKFLFPEYEGYKLVLMFASLRLEEDIVNYLTKCGIYAMAYKEWEYISILNFNELNKVEDRR